MAGYRVSPEAEADLYRIWLYELGQWGLAAADRYNAAFFKHFEQLAERLLLYPAVDDLRQGYRCSVCGSDSVCYRIEGQFAEIMAIIGKQDTDDWLYPRIIRRLRHPETKGLTARSNAEVGVRLQSRRH